MLANDWDKHMIRPLGKMVFAVLLFGFIHCAVAEDATQSQITSALAYLKVLQRVSMEIRPNGDLDGFLKLITKLTPGFKRGKLPAGDDNFEA